MPSKIMDLQGLSPSSYFSQEICFSNERQVGFRKPEMMVDHFGVKMDWMSRPAPGEPVASSPMEKHIPMDSQIAKSLELPNSYLSQLHEGKSGFERHAVGAERAANHHSSTLWRPNTNQRPSPYFAERGVMDSQYENGLFSSSMSELFSRKLRLSSNNDLYGHSVDTVASHYEEEEPFVSLEEIEAQTIGNLLPSEDDLLSGLIDGIDSLAQPSTGDDIEDLDLFSSLGGMDLGDDCYSGQENSDLFGISGSQLVGSNGMVGEHPHGEHPSRTLFVRNINSNVEDSELRTLFEHYGDIRTLYTACKHRGFVMISYYDIRASRNAMRSLQNKALRRRKLDIHYSIPKDNPTDKDVNQGTLVVFNLDTSVSNDELRQIFGVYGEIKEIRETPHRSHHKFIEFYDVRAAEAALRALNRSDIAGKRIKLEASRPGGARRGLMQQLPSELEQDESGSYLQQSSPPINSTTGFSGTVSQGTLISGSFDNGSFLGVHSATRPPISPFMENAFHHAISSSVPNSLSSPVRVDSVGNQSVLAESGHSQSQLKFEVRGASSFHPHSLPELCDGFANGVPCNSPGTVASMAASISSRTSERMESRQLYRVSSNGQSIDLDESVFGSSGNGSCIAPGNPYMWSNSHRPQPPGMMWSNSSSFVNGVCTPHSPQQLHGLPRAPSHMLNSGFPITNHHVGSAPSINPSLWDRRHTYTGESPEASGFHPGSLGNMRISGNSPHPLEFVPHNIFPHVGMDLPVASKNLGLHFPQQRCMMFPSRSQMIPMMTSFDPPNERARSRRNEGNQSENKKQYELDVDRILRGEDNRTTLMIKNIPNKYTSKMLLSAIDERHRGTYDFIYLPIDFKNKCNVGYAFINMTDPSQIIPFYQAFNGKKWEKFNSEKVASLAYARIQGKTALVAHFQNSSLMNEDKRCRPILFHTDGPNAGDQVPFPMGVNVRSRPGKPRASINDEAQQGSPPNGDGSYNGDSGSAKESD